MSFSSEVKEELSKMPINNKEFNILEFIGYCLSGNLIIKDSKCEYITENEFNIERFYKILFNLNIEYEPEIRGKTYRAKLKINDVERYLKLQIKIDDENLKYVVRGAFLRSWFY